ncbi:sulfotransferase family protein [Betaproteobacteria bacterium SCN2]|nr:sulfotransferase family protein [Betaproteobacteria bacterium SCN2]
MISDVYKCIFVEVPKTGSTSIRTIIGNPRKPHMNIWQIANEAGEKKFFTYFKFGFVRNPWDRAVSLYERKEGLQLRDKMSFDEFVGWMKYASSTCLHPVPHRYQLDWFVDPHGNVIVDFIGKFENLDADWRKVAGRLGIDKPLPHANPNPRKKHYTEYYNDTTRKIIADRFAEDIEFFGYEFYPEK